MQICIVTHSLIKGDGQGRVNYEVVQEAIRQGHHVTLLATQISPDLATHPQITWVEIPVKGIPSELLRNLEFSRKSSHWLRHNRSNLDLVNINGSITSAASDANAVHFVHTAWLQSPAHTSRVHKNLYGLYQWLYSTLNSYWEKRSFAKSRIIIAVSEKIKQELIEIGVPADRIKVIFNGVDSEEFTVDRLDRISLQLPQDVTLAFFVGDIRTPRKNLDTVLKALKNTPNLHLAVAGKTDNSPYPRMTEELGITDRVHFLGYRKDISKIMRSVDLFVFPSRYEPFALVLLEAMASGLPVITTSNVGGAALVTADCGIVLEDCNAVAPLTDALNQLSSDPEKRIYMGKASRTIAEKYTWVEMAKSYIQIFEEINL